MDDTILRKVQLSELSILRMFSSFCKNNEIAYSLYGGTALGAIRHEGFIPWDDDIDICMDRKNFRKFVELWKNNPIDGYTLELPNQENYNLTHSKLRKDNTLYCTKEEFKKYKNNGLWIDIFPIDKVPNNFISKKYICFWSSLRLLLARNNESDKVKGLKRLFVKFVLNFSDKKKSELKNKSEKIVTKYENLARKFKYIEFTSFGALTRYFPENLLSEYISVKFENEEFMIMKNYDIMLRIMYGEYMKLPPEKDRVCKHLPDIIEIEGVDIHE